MGISGGDGLETDDEEMTRSTFRTISKSGPLMDICQRRRYCRSFENRENRDLCCSSFPLYRRVRDNTARISASSCSSKLVHRQLEPAIFYSIEGKGEIYRRLESSPNQTIAARVMLDSPLLLFLDLKSVGEAVCVCKYW